MKLRDFCADSHLPNELIHAVVRQLGGWEEAQQSMPDIARYGIDGGFHGFIYYTDTCEFYAKHQTSIRSVAQEMADSLGEGVIGMIQNFNCLDATEDEVGRTLYGPKREHDTQVANALAWFAAEEVARAYDDLG